uniref:Uncharacterized protein n=1 Tax=Anguilla anguilla TaxID=7936 RepID=A0A0E9UTQ9_ANGAN
MQPGVTFSIVSLLNSYTRYCCL